MKTLYTLHCTCGQTVDVDSGQAGLAVRCPCGREIDVPTVRGLATLESRVPSSGGTAAGVWGPRQGTIFLGLAITVLAGSVALYLTVFPPLSPVQGVNRAVLAKEVDRLTPTQTFEMWASLKQGMDRSEMPLMLRYWDLLAQRQRWAWVAWGVAGAGLLIAFGGGLLVRNNSGRGLPRVSSPRS